MPVELLTLKEAAERTRYHPETLRRLVKQGIGPERIMLNGKLLFSTASIDAWIHRSTERRPLQAA